MGGASDEVADTFTTGKGRHGSAISGAGLVRGEDHVRSGAFRTFQVGIKGALPGGAATPDGGPGLFGVEVERRKRNVLDQAGFRCGF